jgi:dipeptidyl aminopeptidase/acylaminoacyl peptidase
MRFRAHLAALLLALVAVPLAAEPTIDGLLAPALPSELVASKDGRAIAWLEFERGERSVWSASAPAWTARQLQRFPGDDGLELSALTWSDDGRWLAFVRGGDEGGAPETNVTSDPAGAAAAVWLVDVSAKAPARKLAEGGGPAFSPRGDRLVLVKGGQLWSVALAGKGEAKQLTHLRGEQGSPRFSPDGGRLAFASNRQTHAFVGVVDLGSNRVAWMDPGVDSDLLPTWSPDGKAVAFLRLPAEDVPPAFLPRRSAAEPWSLRIADAATGSGRELFRAAAGDGSAFHFFETQGIDLWWTADGRIVFPSEKSGWHHLWSLAATGGEPTDLTPCDCEVEHATLAEDGKTFLFTSNELGLDGRTFWRVAAAGGPRTRLDSGESKFEFFPAPLVEGSVAFLETAARQPVTVALRDAAGGVRAIRPGAIPSGFPAADLVEPANVVFPSTDGVAVHGQLFLPRGATAESKVPGVIFVHGGPVRQMFAAPHFWGYYSGAYMMNQLLASRGIAVLSVNYRSGIGYGLAFREANGIGEAGASEFQDVLAGALFLRAQPGIDGARLGIWGGSYGGYLTAMALARASGTFKAGVDYHGVHDWNLEFSNPPFTRDYVATGKRLDRAFAASPMADVATWRSPVLLIHGDDDHNVPFVETVRLAEKLRLQGVPLETLILPDEIHGFLLHRSWLRAYAATLEFFERRLARGE